MAGDRDDRQGEGPARALAGLSRAERRWLVSAALLEPAVTILLRIVGWRRLERGVARLTPLCPTGDRLPTAGDPAEPADVVEPEESGETAASTEAVDPAALARMVRVASIRSPFPSTCLSHSLTLWLLLRRNHVESDLCIGVRRDGRALAAHAWVECRGRPLNDVPDIGEQFVIIHRSTPAMSGSPASPA